MRTSTLPLALGVLVLCAGCSNFQAVNDSAGQLVSAASSWNAVAEEFPASCTRRNLVSTVSDTCATEKQAAAGLEATNASLSAYFSALQQASTGKNFSVDPGISGLSTSIDAIPGVNKGQADALSGLAKFLADVATRALEERTIDLLISQGGPKAEGVLDTLSDVVVPQLTNTLEREKDQTLASFASYTQQAGGDGTVLQNADCSAGISAGKLQNGVVFMLAEDYCTRANEIATKLSALDSYKTSLATAKSTLQALQSNKDNLGAKELIQQLISDATTLKSAIDQVNKAF